LVSRRARSLPIILLLVFMSALLVPAPNLTIPEMRIPEIKILPFTQITIPKITIPALNLHSLGNLPRVFAAPFTLGLSAATGAKGSVITLTGTGVNAGIPAGTPCSESDNSPGSSLVTSFTAGVTSPGNLFGSFVVGTAPAAAGGVAYTITVSCSIPTITDTGSQPFTPAPSITLNPPVGVQNQIISVTGVGFRSDASACAIAIAAPVSAVILPTCSLTGSGGISGQFTVDIVSGNGPYTITVSQTAVPGGPPATANFNKVSGPTIFIDPTGAAVEIVPVGFGTLDGGVSVFGGGFSTGSSRSCTISTNPVSTMIATSPAPTCTISSIGTVSGSFAVNPGAAVGPYVIRVTDSNPAGVYAEYTAINAPCGAGGLCLSAQPTQPTLGAGNTAGASVTVTSGANTFSQRDVGPCAILSSPTGLFSSTACTINGAGALVAGSSFVISSTAPGQTYQITVQPIHGDTSALATLTVVPAVTVNPTTGSPPVTGPGPTAPATEITVTGTGFSTADTSCTLTATTPANLVIDQTGEPACTVNGSTGVLSVKFKIGTNSPYTGAGSTVKVQGNNGGALDFALSVAVTITPQLVLSPTSGAPGTLILYAGAGFTATAAGPACAVNPNIAGTPVDPATKTCNQKNVAPGIGTAFGQFNILAGTLSGSYVITYTDANAAGPTATAQLAVTGGPIVTLLPNTGPTGTPVTVTGSGFNAGDGYVRFVTTPASTLFGPPTTIQCSVSGGNIASGCTFTVNSNAPGLAPPGYVLTFTGQTGDTSVANFLLTSSLTLTPNNGGDNTAVTITGSGYITGGGGGTNCKTGMTSSPAGVLFAGPSANPAICSIDVNGLLTGSFATVDAAAPVGPYTVTLANGGWGALVVQTTVSSGFTVKQPLVTFSSPSGSGGDTITFTGTGFSTGDASVTLTGGANIVTSLTYTITSGTMTGSFKVGTAGTPAQTAVTLTLRGNLGDSAGNTFSVNPRITFSPNPARVKSTVSITGTNFKNGAGGCSISGPSVDPNPTNIAAGCELADFTLDPAVAKFIVLKTFVPLSDIITVSDGAGGVSTTATLNMIPHVVTPSPASGPIGATIYVTGTGFTTTDTAASTINGPPVTGGPAVCLTAIGGTITCSFVVKAATVPGTYTLTLTGVPDGDVGTATFIVTPGLSLLPASGRAGTNILVTGSNFLVADTGCAITSSPTGLISSPLCTVAAGSMSGSFTVATGSSGAYSVIVTGTPGGDAASVAFSVPLPPTLTLSPSTGPVGQSVIASGSNYAGTTCLVTASPGSLFTSMTCSIAAGTLTGGFTVGSSASGSYTVTVTTNAGALDSATASFTVTAGPAPTLTLSPINGTVGTAVTASGSNYAGTSCTLSSSPAGLLSAPTCSISAHTLTGGFAVPSGASAGGYIVTVTSNVGETVVATFTVLSPSAPTLTLTPNSGLVGTAVTVSGSNYAGTTCSLSASTSGFLSAPTCTISSGTLTGSFTVASGASAGSYIVTVTTNVAADTRTATFTVPAATLFLSPISGPAGTPVTASGSNYAGTTCSLSASPSDLLSSSTCSISAHTLTAGFTVASGASIGAHTVTVMTNVAADTTTASFTVTSGAPPPSTFTLSPTSGPGGKVVTASGSNYVGTTCSLSSSPSGLLSSATCSIAAGTLTGGFIVASGVSPGSYIVTVTTNVATDTKTATFTVPVPTFTLNPTSGGAATSVTVSGSNYAGTTCALSATPSSLFTSSTCSISAGTLSGGFVVASSARGGSYTVTVTTEVSGETKSASFTVTAPLLPTCVIATATYGSEMAPEVVYMRSVRDNMIGSTPTGAVLRDEWNRFYYSWSPQLAAWISQTEDRRAIFRVLLVPLDGIIHVTAWTWTALGGGDIAAVAAFLLAALLSTLTYIVTPAYVAFRASKRAIHLMHNRRSK
jgi:hypothetical protein